MKILQLITRMDTIGGAQVHVRDISVGLRNLGHDVHLISGIGGNIFGEFEAENIPYIECKELKRDINILSDIKAFWCLRKAIQQIDPDIIAIHSSKAGIIGRLVGKSLRIPTVYTAHGWSFTEGVPIRKKRIYKIIERCIGRITDGVITVSEYDRNLAINEKVIKPDRIETIHNGVKVSELSEVKAPREKITTLIMVARFSPPKKQLTLIRCLANIRKPYKMLFVGDGPFLENAKNYSRELGLETVITFTGNRRDVENLLISSDIFVLLSDWEGLPISIIEAMGCGMPVIATDIGGISELIKENENGFLIRKHDMDHLQQKIELLLTNPVLRKRMGKQSRRIYETNFTFERMLHRTNDFYFKIVKQKGASI